MKDDSNSTVDLDQTDEGILTYDVSDEALEAAAGTERGGDRSAGYCSVCTFTGGACGC